MAQRQRIEVKQSLRLKLSVGLRASIDMLRLDATGLARQMEEQAAENPSLTLTAPVPKDWLPRWAGVLPGAARAEPMRADMGETAAGPGPSLMAHVLAEIDRRIKAPQDRKVAVLLAEALAPSGWLDRPVLAIAREAGVMVAEVEAVLYRLQETEPAGLFARNLAECLKLQAQEAGIYDAAMKLVLANLDLLALGATARLAQMAGVAEADILRRFRSIRTMNPKPGTAFEPLMAETLREPDLLARKRADGGWEIVLNGAALPEMRIEAKAGSAETRAAARMLERMVVARNDTLLRVGTEVLRRQQPALSEGASRLQPMTMAEVAASLDLHESTVSRVVAGTSVDTPWGVWWLRKLFSRGLGPQDGDEALSAAAMRDLLARRIAAEPASAPLSDEALASSLAADLGVTIARRTVAKYRSMLGIPPAHRRKLRAP
jgi:RNA polymerase sigma-54 factor